MAEIPVTREPARSFPWWIVVLLLLAAAVAVYFLVIKKDSPRETVAVVTTSQDASGSAVMASDAAMAGGSAMMNNDAASPADAARMASSAMMGNDTMGGAAMDDPFSDMTPVYGAKDRSIYVGHGVDVGRVTVKRLISDRVFTVTVGDGELYVMLDESLDRGAAEQAVQIKAGQELSLGGKIASAPNAATVDERMRGLSADDAKGMRDQGVYLQITRIGAPK